MVVIFPYFSIVVRVINKYLHFFTFSPSLSLCSQQQVSFYDETTKLVMTYFDKKHQRKHHSGGDMNHLRV